MTNLRKLLPGAQREPKILVVFSNRQEDCDRLIRYLSRRVANSPVTNFPIHVYCLEKPYESQRCAHLVVDPDPRRLFSRARQELANSWVALSATSWNNVRRGTLLKILPLTIPPFRGIVGNENGDFFELRLIPATRHMIDRGRQWFHHGFAGLGQWYELRLAWPARHGIAWLRRKVKDKMFWGTAVTLGKMAWFARRVGPMTRTMFERLPQGEPSPMESVVEENAAGITRIEYRDLDWRREEIAAAIESSGSRFVLFCPPDYWQPFDDFLPLFNDNSTFAVTRQSGYREWRPVMVTLSPFRILKPKEASRVAAPLAPVLLIDRKKLVKLGVPQTLVFGVAWLSLFWRANAAGWRSYSVGGAGTVPQQIDFWLEEMLFVKHLYLNPDLQRLAGETPLLTRGNITFRPDLIQPYRSLPRVLVLSPYVPFPLSHGGVVRIYNLCKALADQVDFILVCFREVTDDVDYEELHRIFRRVYVVDRDEINKQAELPDQVNYYQTSSMRALVADVAAQQAVDLLQIEYTDLAAYREVVPNRPAILVEHDITYTLHRQLAEQNPSEKNRREYDRWRRFEAAQLRAFDSVFVMSAQDQDEAVSSGANRQRTYVIPNGVDLQRFRALAPPEGETEIFYVGSFRHLPNYLGFEELRCNIMPLVWEKYPHAKLRVIAGPDHEKCWRAALNGAAIPHLDPRIIIHGFVSDLVPLYEKAHIVAVPLPLSAGTNIKVMEAMSCQRAVVTTPVGAQGLGLRHEIDALICPLGPEFSNSICRLIEEPLFRDEIARKGRAAADARFGWNAIARDMLDAYSLLVRESGTQRPAGNGSQREQQKEEEQYEDNQRGESRRILESA